MNCSKCGAQNIDGVTFCGSCGTPMRSFIPPAPETPQQNLPNEDATFQPQQPQYQQQSYGNQSQGNYQSQGSSYSAPGGIPYNGGMVPPNNYMTVAIIVTIVSTLCCCSPISIILGVIAIIKANSVNSEFERGNIDEAIRNSVSAKKLVIWAAVIALLFYVTMQIVGFLLIIPAMGGLEELLNNMNY